MNTHEVISVLHTALKFNIEIKKEMWLVFFSTFSISISVISLFCNNAIFVVICSIILAIIIAIVFLYSKYRCTSNKGKIINQGSTKITVKFGDIEKEEGFKLIPCDSNLCIGDSSVISVNSLQFIFSKKLTESFNVDDYYNDKGLWHSPIDSEKDFCLFSLIELDNDNIAKCTTEEYIGKVYDTCKIIEKVAKKREIVIPIIGSGIKKTDRDMTSIDCLNLLIVIFKLYPFNRETSIKIIVNDKKHSMNDINLLLL